MAVAADMVLPMPRERKPLLLGTRVPSNSNRSKIVFISHINEEKARSQDCVGSAGTALPPGRSVVKVRAGPLIFIFPKTSRPALGLAQALTQWVTGDIFSEKKSVAACRYSLYSI